MVAWQEQLDAYRDRHRATGADTGAEAYREGFHAATRRMLHYVDRKWSGLTRDFAQLYYNARDPKVLAGLTDGGAATHVLVVYAPADEAERARIESELNAVREELLGSIREHRVIPVVDEHGIRNFQRRDGALRRSNGQPLPGLVKHAGTKRFEALDDGRKAQLLERFPRIEVRPIPANPADITENSLLYLPHPYVVPGARFNELYGWDTAFVIRALLQSGHYDLAKGMVDNFIYEIEHYGGAVLNGSRSYYLGDPPRSQPPLFTAKALQIAANWERMPESARRGQSMEQWLTQATKAAETYFDFWVKEPHRHAPSGLAQYNARQETPAPEVISSEFHEVSWGEATVRLPHYAIALKGLVEADLGMAGEVEGFTVTPFHVRQYSREAALPETAALLHHTDAFDMYLDETSGIPYAVIHGDTPRTVTLSGTFFRGDRAMRESGFDITQNNGYYGADVIFYLDVGLNALRAKMAREIGEMHALLGDAAAAERWQAEFESIGGKINAHLWDANGNTGPAYRNRLIHAEALSDGHPEFRAYDFATALFPLWAGVATPERAEATIVTMIPRLLTEHGLQTSTHQSGNQWDAPMMWAPLQVVAIETLEKHSYYYTALELSYRYLATLLKDYDKTGKLYEKYEAVGGTSEGVGEFIRAGYNWNVEGFAWTNAAVIETCRAIVRLQHKIRGEELEGPSVLDNFNVRQTGTARAPKDSPGQFLGGPEKMRWLELFADTPDDKARIIANLTPDREGYTPDLPDILPPQFVETVLKLQRAQHRTEAAVQR